MSKKQVMLEIPAISKQFEMMLPEDLQIREILSLLIGALGELSNGLYHSSGTEVICVRNQKTVLNIDRKLRDYDIGNGDHLILI